MLKVVSNARAAYSVMTSFTKMNTESQYFTVLLTVSFIQFSSLSLQPESLCRQVLSTVTSVGKNRAAIYCNKSGARSLQEGI